MLLHAFVCRFFSSRGFGIIIEVFCFALAWNCVAMATFMKINWFPFKFTVSIYISLLTSSLPRPFTSLYFFHPLSLSSFKGHCSCQYLWKDCTCIVEFLCSFSFSLLLSVNMVSFGSIVLHSMLRIQKKFLVYYLIMCLLCYRFSRLYYSWVCVESLTDVLLMCQFTNLVSEFVYIMRKEYLKLHVHCTYI